MNISAYKSYGVHKNNVDISAFIKHGIRKKYKDNGDSAQLLVDFLEIR